MKPLRQDAILLLVANPVDVLTSAAQRMSGLPKGQVIGSGTLLDSVRLRRALAARLQVSDAAVHASVIGEHGDSQCVAWSSASVYGNPLMHILPLTDAERKALEHSTRNKAASIIAAKGFTSYGVAATTTMICESIIFDQCHVLPISHWVDDLGCCLSLPAIVGRKGVRGAVKMTLDDEERKLLEKSAQSLKEVLEQCEAYFKKHEEQGQEQSTK
jgi:L-lactate dehydrogenase